MFNSGDWVKKKNVINVQTRSVMGMLYLLSHSGSVPPEHEKLGWVGKTLNADGSPFDWSRITKGLFVINVSSEKPSDADIMVKYRDKWFSVARNDLSTKKIFNIISLLLALQSGTNDVKPPALPMSSWAALTLPYRGNEEHVSLNSLDVRGPAMVKSSV